MVERAQEAHRLVTRSRGVRSRRRGREPGLALPHPDDLRDAGTRDVGTRDAGTRVKGTRDTGIRGAGRRRPVPCGRGLPGLPPRFVTLRSPRKAGSLTGPACPLPSSRLAVSTAWSSS
jgi:hypothetical protein